jgi:FYVE/RhoGEF/PH domain-containing protein 5/6
MNLVSLAPLEVLIWSQSKIYTRFCKLFQKNYLFIYLINRSARDREDWMKALNVAIQDNIRKRSCRTPDQLEGLQLGKIAPVWIQDSRVTMCQICTAEFRLTFRRHHCKSSTNQAKMILNDL